jgi:hypothetical protein
LQRRREANRERRIVVLGENSNDTGALAQLIVALCEAATGRVRTVRQPLVLKRGQTSELVRDKRTKVMAVLRAQGGRAPVTCLFIHRDCDDVEPHDEALATEIENDLHDLAELVHAVVPAWELETWWLLWPDLTASVRSSWRVPEAYRGREVGMIRNAKQALRSALNGNDRARYRESDSIAIAEAIRRAGVATRPEGRSSSYARFQDAVARCCNMI